MLRASFLRFPLCKLFATNAAQVLPIKSNQPDVTHHICMDSLSLLDQNIYCVTHVLEASCMLAGKLNVIRGTLPQTLAVGGNSTSMFINKCKKRPTRWRAFYILAAETDSETFVHDSTAKESSSLGNGHRLGGIQEMRNS